MLRCYELVTGETAQCSLSLPFTTRQKSRFTGMTDRGEEVQAILPRGSVLRGGSHLRSEEGVVVLVAAASEAISLAQATTPLAYARACYHLGNRHVALQILDGLHLAYLRDHVLDAMLLRMGLTLVHELAPFEPEDGAYAGDGHRHDGH